VDNITDTDYLLHSSPGDCPRVGAGERYDFLSLSLSVKLAQKRPDIIGITVRCCELTSQL
jgi:hypothetical protein